MGPKDTSEKLQEDIAQMYSRGADQNGEEDGEDEDEEEEEEGNQGAEEDS